MTIMTRIVRLWKADFNGFMDELEDKNLLLKQHIREMEEELDKKKQLSEEMKLEKEQLLDESNQYNLEKRELEKDLRITILKEKNDIARMLVKKITILDRHIKNHVQQRLILEQKTHKLQEKIKEQQTQCNQLKQLVKEYLVKENRGRKTTIQTNSSFHQTHTEHEPSSEEIELELLKYKEIFETAGQGEQS